ncbi:hypothetical protein [Aeromicrobium wangtongii]|uniref:hypothetical protein n=1 Tax=Aeromicrobium wangtongii TaxID=2969247 RepID=UPI002017FED8|nr:hypothetical protein [Aeromicrobium wangtongii]MCL3818761.1 hypothetical protein [Aeromicrobium wangtongii]
MGAVFPTKWDFLFATVLIGVDRTTGVFSGSEPTPGQQMVAVWTSEEIATAALHVESWELKQIKVRELLALLPDGIGVVVDPERSTGMTAPAAYVAQLKRYVSPFPPGSQVRVDAWQLDEAVRNAVIDAATGTGSVQELYAFSYTVDDSPPLGCIAYVAEARDSDAVGAPIDSALSASTSLEELGVATVTITGMGGVPEEVRAALGDAHLLHRRRQSRFWRR